MGKYLLSKSYHFEGIRHNNSVTIFQGTRKEILNLLFLFNYKTSKNKVKVELWEKNENYKKNKKKPLVVNE